MRRSRALRCAALGADAVFDKSTELDALIEYCMALQPRTQQGVRKRATRDTGNSCQKPLAGTSSSALGKVQAENAGPTTSKGSSRSKSSGSSGAMIN